MKTHFRNWLAVLALMLFTIPVAARADAYTDDEKSEEISATYQRGTDALDEGNWSSAISHFDRVIRASGAKADGALYWKAYAQNKLGRRTEALETVAQMKKAYPKSRWNNDANALEIEIRQSAGQPVRPEQISNEDEKLMAINALMHMDPDRAVGTLEKILNSTRSPKLKDRALFVLSQNPSPKAQQMIADFAVGNANSDLQKRAIKYLGISGGEANAKLLADIYAKISDAEVRKSVLRSFMISGNKTQLLRVAKGEKDVVLRSEAVRQLGVMGSKDELWDLYQSETSNEVKKDIIRAMFIGGSAELLGELARSEKDPELRATAIKNLGLIGGAKTGELLLSIYQSDPNLEIREAVIKGLFVQGNAKALIQLARKETNPELKRKLVKQLSIMGSPEATEFMLEILEQ
ncbi:MAG TPA: HEAT repeat domain-containing protein [Thermoanaerobaculia bacterium]